MTQRQIDVETIVAKRAQADNLEAQARRLREQALAIEIALTINSTIVKTVRDANRRGMRIS